MKLPTGKAIKLISLILLLAFSSLAADRQRLVAAIVDTDPGTFVNIQLTDRTRLSGRLRSVGPQSLQVEVADKGSIVTREVRFDTLRSFRARKPVGTSFSRDFESGAAVTLGVFATIFGVVLLMGVVS